MKKNIHPPMTEITMRCVCGTSYSCLSTLTENQEVEFCSKCHPFYTGKKGKEASVSSIKRFKEKFPHIDL